MSTAANSNNFVPMGGKFGVRNEEQYKNPQVKTFQNKTNSYQQKAYKKLFADYISEDEAKKGVEDGTMYQGILRINPKNYQECFLDNPKGTDFSDVLCFGPDRNRAMQGDLVTVKFKPKEEWLIQIGEYKKWWDETRNGQKMKNEDGQKKTLKSEITENGITLDEVPDNCVIPTAAVVRIDEERHHRVAAGKLTPMQNNNYFVLFVSTDSKIPRIMIPNGDVDPEFFKRPADFVKFLYTAKISEWRAESIYANGRLVKMIGKSGEIGTETERILYENQIDDREFNEECLSSLPLTGDEWKIPEEEFEYRRDYRNDIIFTIDPKTARDLDDALSIQHIEDCDGKGTPGLEIGVHIADVTYFVKEDTELDNWAASRGNSTYLAQLVVPMLPRILCEQLCSLNPGVDRLAFSAVFKMSYEAELQDVWFGRTVIRSKVKLAYEHAQDFIENPEKDFAADEIPEVFDGCTVYQIKEKVLMLHKVAQQLRSKRESGGALRIEQPKLKFSVDPVSKEPMGVSVYEIKDSNKLVEEFMLLANMEVAQRIENSFPKTAFLRCHPPPKGRIIDQVIEQCRKIGFPLEGKTSRLLSESFKKYNGNSRLHTCIRQVISSLTIKPMKQALYFCTGATKSTLEYRHYALNVDYYTHFTSPIRRYPDIIVHRQLAAALEYSLPSELNVDQLKGIASHCNETKLASKSASEQSSELYFGFLVHSVGKISSRGVVIGVLDKAFDVILVDYGIIKRVHADKITAKIVSFDKNDEKLTIEWPADSAAESGNKDAFQMDICVTTVIDVEVRPLKDIECLAVMLRPNREQRKIAEKRLRIMFDEESHILD